MLFACYLLEHNIPFSAADHAGSLFAAMFPSSLEAKAFAAARTKTTCLVKTFASASQADLVKAIKNGKFSFSSSS